MTCFFSVLCFKGCHKSVFIIHVCSASFTVRLPYEQNDRPCHMTTRCFESFSSALYGTFTPIVPRCLSCNQSQLFRDTERNCQRPELLSLTLRVVTACVGWTKSNRHLWSCCIMQWKQSHLLQPLFIFSHSWSSSGMCAGITSWLFIEFVQTALLTWLFPISYTRYIQNANSIVLDAQDSSQRTFLHERLAFKDFL